MDRKAHEELQASILKEPAIIYYSTVNMKPMSIKAGTLIHEESSLFQVLMLLTKFRQGIIF